MGSKSKPVLTWADEACHRELNHHFADIPYYGKVEFHSTEVCEETGKVKLQEDEDLINET